MFSRNIRGGKAFVAEQKNRGFKELTKNLQLNSVPMMKLQKFCLSTPKTILSMNCFIELSNNVKSSI